MIMEYRKQMKGYDETKHKRLGEQGECEWCGNIGELVVDPYAEDVAQEIVYVTLCDNCREQSAMDI